jgi:hypothetical protein
MADNSDVVLYTAVYDDVSTALSDLDALEGLHKDDVVGKFDAAVIDQENGKPHIVKRMDRPRIRVIPERSGRERCRARTLRLQPKNSRLAKPG